MEPSPETSPEAVAAALVKAATKTPEQMLNLSAAMPEGFLDRAMEPLERLRTEAGFAWHHEADCPTLAARLVQAVELGDVVAIGGLAAALHSRGGDMFAQRAITAAWSDAVFERGGVAPPLLAIRKGDLLQIGTPSTRFRVLEREDDGVSYGGDQPEPVFLVQPIRNGKDYGGPEPLRLGKIVGFAPDAPKA